MKKGIIILVIIVLLVGGGVFALSKLKFDGKSTVTVNGETKVSYSAGQYYQELNDKIKAFYNVINRLDLSQAKESQINSLVTDANAALSDTERFIKGIDTISGNGSEELNSSVNEWISAERGLLANQYINIAKLIGEDGKVNSQAEADQANALINTIDSNNESNDDKLNNALDKFYNLNK